jgi:phage tail-like protein
MDLDVPGSVAAQILRLTTLDPAPGFRYYIEQGGILLGAFTECTGLYVERKTEQVREGGVNDFVHTLPGSIERGIIVLKHGVIFSTELWDWFQKGLRDGKVERRNVSIILVDAGSLVPFVGPLPARTWWFGEVFPAKWTGPELKAGESAAAIETLELAYGGSAGGEGEGGEGGDEGEGGEEEEEEEKEEAVDLPALGKKIVALLETEMWIECERQAFR